MTARVRAFLPTLRTPGHDGFTRAEQVLPAAVQGIETLRTAET